MLPPWPLPLRHSHSCLYTRSVFERRNLNCNTVVVIHACTRGLSFEDFLFSFLRPFVRGTPTTHSEGLLLRVGALPCAPTYNHGVVQHVVFNRLGLAQPHECSSKAAFYHANSSATSSNNLYRGHNWCTTHASKAIYRYFLGIRLRLPRRVTLERVPTDWYFLFSACGVDMLPPRPSQLRHSHPVGLEILF